MRYIQYKSTAIGLACALNLYSLVAAANEPYQVLTCKVDGSDDHFRVYAEQGIYDSDQFVYYQIIGGLTVLVLNKASLRFNRLTNLNLLPHSTLDPNQPAEPLQLFSGQCRRD